MIVHIYNILFVLFIIANVCNGDYLINHVAGTGVAGYNAVSTSPKENENVQFRNPNSVTSFIDPSSGDLYVYVADSGNHVIRMITGGNTITIAGVAGNPGFNGNGYADTKHLYNPACVAVDVIGDLYIADKDNNLIRKIIVSANTISNVAGNGNMGTGADNVLSTSSALNRPRCVVVDSSGNIYISGQAAF